MRPLVAIIGPTAVGKSKIAISLAKDLPGEIISLDSMLVYRELNIGVDKVPVEKRSGIPHHLIDLISLDQVFDAGKYLREVDSSIKNILEREKNVFIVGGCGFYLKALQYGMYQIPSIPEEIKKGLQERLRKEGLPALYAELKEVDLSSSQRIHSHDKYRIIRALEVFSAFNVPLSNYRCQFKKNPRYQFIKIGLEIDRQTLRWQIQKRVERMFSAGLLDEVKGLISQNHQESLTKLPAIGYREVLCYLKGEYSLVEAKDLIIKRTTALAKRQLTWFRQDKEISWYPVDNYEKILIDLKNELKIA